MVYRSDQPTMRRSTNRTELALIKPHPLNDWLDRVFEEAIRDTFGEPSRSPEYVAIQRETIHIAITGRNFCRIEVDPTESLEAVFGTGGHAQ